MKKTKAQKKLERKIKEKKKLKASENLILSSSTDDQYIRIYKILDAENAEDENSAAVSYENLEKYLAFLKKEIAYPVVVTGIEDAGCFGWEEFYIWGPGSEKEYEKLKKKYPSFRDEYELLSFNEDFDDEGLYVSVQRISDKKKFTLTLADLKTVEKNSENVQLLDDYAVWHTNFR
ncbi:MAG: hypothetical protein GY795_47045 [Desulfobacterales bacterium]|nr:hypothetical protein [Desulfobacterales bacterium]